MKIKKGDKICYNCAGYFPYYRVGCACFWQERSGFCAKCKQSVSECSACEKFVMRKNVARVTPQALSAAIENVTYILNYYKKEG